MIAERLRNQGAALCIVGFAVHFAHQRILYHSMQDLKQTGSPLPYYPSCISFFLPAARE